MTATDSTRRPRVLVLYGGQSSEHAVSCVTAAGVLNAIDRSRFDVVPVGVTAAGQWTVPTVDPRTHAFSASEGLPAVESAGSSVQLHCGSEGADTAGAELFLLHPDGSTEDFGTADVAMPLLHGPFGEDGTLQGLLELSGLPYVGAGVLSSAIGMDKHFMKIAFASAGLRVGPWETITAAQWSRAPEAALERVRALELPVFVKPARGGSSVGITRVDDWSELDAALDEARRHDPKVVVEQGIAGREIECGVLGGRDGAAPRASLPGEIVVGDGEADHQFYDFTAKYTDGAAADLSCPADLPEEAEAEIRRQAVLAFEALDCEGLCRADFFYAESGEIIVNEVNTMPGFTPISMYPQMWKATGIEYPELITELLELAISRGIGLR